MENKMTVNFTGKIKPVKPINDQFTLCKCYIMALGSNANGSHFSKEAVDDALPTLYNIPVVGNIYIDEDGETRAGGHDVELVETEDGYEFHSLTVPYGTVPQQDDVHYEDITEPNGDVNTYQVADIILWTGRYPEILDAKYDEDIYFAQSMEIIPLETKQTDMGLDISKYQYSALCLLGKSDDPDKNVLPCFKSAKVKPYKFSSNDQITQLFNEFKTELAKTYSIINISKGGEQALNKETITKILREFGLSEDMDLPFEITDEMSEDELRDKIAEIKSSDEPADNDAVDEPAVEPQENVNDDEPAAENANEDLGDEQPAVENAEEDAVVEDDNDANDENSENFEDESHEPIKYSVDLTYNETRDKLFEALRKFDKWDENTFIQRVLIDFNDDYVYALYINSSKDKDEIRMNVRIPYTVNDDDITVDIVNSVEVRQVWLTKEDEEKLDAKKQEFESLVEYKANRVAEDRNKAYSAVLSEFADLAEYDDYKVVVKNALAFESLDALKEKLYAIRGKNFVKATKKPLDNMRIPVGKTGETKKNLVDEFMSTYGSKNFN